MSLDGLLSEVRNFHSHNLDVALGEQLFYGNKRVFSDVRPGTSNQGGDNQNKGGKGNKSELKGAIDNAKNIANKALNEGPSGTDGAVVDSLRADHSELAQKVDALSDLIKQLQLEIQSLKSGKVLILGDGNLSFSLSIALSRPLSHFTCTVFDSREMFLEKYGAFETLDELSNLHNVELVFAVDATKLETNSMLGGGFDEIIMNFPHPGGKTNLKKSRILLSGIFRSLRKIMSPEARFRLSLAIGQSGLDFTSNIEMETLPLHKKDSWQAIYLGAEEGFTLEKLEEFDPDLYASYKSAGYKETKKGFNNRKGLTLVFRTSPIDNQEVPLEQWKALNEEENSQSFSYIRPFYIQDLSFLFKEEEYSGEILALNLVEKLSGSCIAEIKEVGELRSICPNPELPNRIYRIIWQGRKVPFGRATCARIHEELRRKIVERIEKLNLPLTAAPAPAAAAPAAAAPAGDDDDFDLFGSDEEDDEEKKRITEERLKAYNEKKSKKAAVIAKSSVILDVKPWDDETDLAELEKLVRSIELDGLVWGGGKLIPIGYGIKKLQIICVIEDLKVSVDDLIEKITDDFESHVQSVDIVAFNKI
ncbi:unnamed protein product [Caenorhabditis angaria]|uniref:Uncharacterized protein n=1 Tax=Caenorhabditis angaria TaxID=860376 RepID=A0A9P1INF6_9PELO|nr:unnamed protein product [Caenorhabditis angaria]